MRSFALTILFQCFFPASCHGIVIPYLKYLFYHLRPELVETHTVHGCKIEDERVVSFFRVSISKIVKGYVQ